MNSSSQKHLSNCEISWGVFSSRMCKAPTCSHVLITGEAVAGVVRREEDKGAERSAPRPHSSPASPPGAAPHID